MNIPFQGVGTTKKCYMPYDAVEDVSITGGTFYSDRQLDSELVQVCVNSPQNFDSNTFFFVIYRLHSVNRNKK